MQLVHNADYVDLTESEAPPVERFTLGVVPDFASRKFMARNRSFYYDEVFEEAFLDAHETYLRFEAVQLESQELDRELDERSVRALFGTAAELPNDEATARLAQLLGLHFIRRALLKPEKVYVLLTSSHTLWFCDSRLHNDRTRLFAFNRTDLRRFYKGARILIPVRP